MIEPNPLTILLFATLVACSGSPSGVVTDQADIQVAETRFDSWSEARSERNQKCSQLPDMTGKSLRVYEMFATHPTELINEFWALGIEDYTIVLLFHVVKDDRVSCEMELQITSAWADREQLEDGTWIAHEYRYALQPALLRLSVSGMEFEILEPLMLAVFAETVNLPIHLTQLEGGGDFTNDGQIKMEFKLEGFLPEPGTYDLCLAFPGLGPANMHWFLTLGGVCPEGDEDGDGTIDAYLFKGIVRAQDESDLFQPGSHQIETNVTECPHHDEACTPHGGR